MGKYLILSSINRNSLLSRHCKMKIAILIEVEYAKN